MNYLLLAVIGTIATILYGLSHKRKTRPPKSDGIFGNCLGDFGGDEETQTQTQTQTNQYSPETLGAKKNWWETLQSWGQPGANYGATDMNWDEIFKTAQKKLQQYYWGSATSPGAIGKVKASAARRGVSESPAMDELTGRMGIEQAGQQNDLFTNLTTQKANYTESARKTWLQSLMGLAGQGAIGQTGTTTTPKESFDWFTPLMTAVGTIGGSMVGMPWLGAVTGGGASMFGGGGGMPSASQSSVSLPETETGSFWGFNSLFQ